MAPAVPLSSLGPVSVLTGQPRLGDRFGLRRLVEIDATKGTASVAKSDRFGRRSTVRTHLHTSSTADQTYPKTDTGPDDNNGTAGATGIGLYV